MVVAQVLWRYQAPTAVYIDLHLRILSRLLYPDDVAFPLVDLEDAMRTCFNHIVSSEVNDAQWDAVRLPTRFGGCGLSDPMLIISDKKMQALHRLLVPALGSTLLLPPTRDTLKHHASYDARRTNKQVQVSL